MQKLNKIECTLMCIMVALAILVCLPSIHSVQASDRRASCANNLKQMGLVMKMYMNESMGEIIPPLSPVAGNWIPDIQAIAPDYLTDADVLMCPGSPLTQADAFQDTQRPECITSAYYTYTGFMLSDDYDAVALMDTWILNGWESIRNQSVSLQLPYGLTKNSRGGSSMYIMWDRVDLDTQRMSHEGRGINILFMDGHVEYEPYDPRSSSHYSPMTSVYAEVFGTIPEICR